jgi:DUF2917 family protein
MQVELRQANITLDAHRVLSLTDAAGAEVEVVTGHVWLTTDGDLRDIFLVPGESHSIVRSGLTIINAVEPSVVHVQPPQARPAAWKQRLRKAWDVLVSVGEARARARMKRGIYYF